MSSQTSLARTLRKQLATQHAHLQTTLPRSWQLTRHIRRATQQWSNSTDAVLLSLWQAIGDFSNSALIATGGYGRQELFPGSDIDVILLQGAHFSPDAIAQWERWIQLCWDARLSLGSSVKTLAECIAECSEDVRTATALLDARYLAGDHALFAQLQTQLRIQLKPQDFFLNKRSEWRERHRRYANTPFALEPNCKESPGGLRDIQTILWLAKTAGLGTNFEEMSNSNLISLEEKRELTRAYAALSAIRWSLHSLAKRHEDRLVFDWQPTVAQSLGFKTKAPIATSEKPRIESEALMHRYYQIAQSVTQITQSALLHIESRLWPRADPKRPLNKDFFEQGKLLHIHDPQLFEKKPAAIFETFELYQNHRDLQGLGEQTLRALYLAQKKINKSFRADPINRAAFMRLLQNPQGGITRALRLMNQTSILGCYLTDFKRIVGRMQHDLFHVYTVDQHILTVVRNIRRFFIAEHAHEFPLCSELAASFEKSWVLVIAALFHDIAKGRGQDHSVLGAKLAARFCKQHEINQEETELIVFLVREHLSLSRVAQKEDLNNPEVITAFADKVQNETYLNALYLLTVADIRGTSPKVWNAWRAKLFEDLYTATLEVLGGHRPDTTTTISSRQQQARTQLVFYGLPAPDAFWSTLDVPYFLRHNEEELAWHARQVLTHAAAFVKVRASQWATNGLQVMVYTPDVADLFAHICAYFSFNGFSVQHARIHTSLSGMALDTFEVSYRDEMIDPKLMIDRIEIELARALCHPSPLPAIALIPQSSRHSRRARFFPILTRIELQPDETQSYWVLEIRTSDKAGLLYRMARVLAVYQLSVSMAKITTLGERAEDIFLISGNFLHQPQATGELEKALLEALAT